MRHFLSICTITMLSSRVCWVSHLLVAVPSLGRGAQTKKNMSHMKESLQRVSRSSLLNSKEQSVTDGVHQIHKHTYTVCVEGNIGSGKTSLLNHFLNYKDIEVIQEPVNLWRNVRGFNLLDYMYRDPRRWGMALQTYVQLTMLNIHINPQVQPVRMMERSIHSARHCFVENLHNSGNMPEVEYTILDEWYLWISKTHNVHVDLFVYLYTSPETCFERIKRRCRMEEMRISMDLLQNLHILHEDWFKRRKFPIGAPVLTIDANCELPLMFEKYREHEPVILGRKAAS